MENQKKLIDYHTSLMVPRADFKPKEFDIIIKQKGYRVIWEQGMFCSCYERSGQPNYNCPICGGRGYVYFGSKSTRALVTSIRGPEQQEQIGLDERGSAYLTTLSEDNVGFRDKFTFLDFTMKFSEVIMGDRYGNKDKLRYPALSIECLRDINKIYKEGIDFLISQDGKFIEWIENARPEVQYSILYNTMPVYIAINPIHELRGTYTLYKGEGKEYFVKLPKQFQIKREDFLTPDDL